MLRRKVGRPKKKVVAVVKREPEMNATPYLLRRVGYFRDANDNTLKKQYITPTIAAENYHLIDKGFICPRCCHFAGVTDDSGAVHYLPNHSKGRLQKRPECKNKLFSQRVKKEVRVVMVVVISLYFWGDIDFVSSLIFSSSVNQVARRKQKDIRRKQSNTTRIDFG